MPVRAAFRRLVLGSAGPPEPGGDGGDRVVAVAGAWRGCLPELERRRSSLRWSGAPPADAPVAARLAALPDPERAAVVAQALGLTPEEVERALEAGPAPGLLARAHAGLAGSGLPAGEACAEEREQVAVGRRTSHCADCEAFAAAAGKQRRELRAAAKEAEGDARRELRVATEEEQGSRVAVVAGRLLEPRRALARVAVGLVVLLVGGGAGFGLVRAYEAPDRGDSIGEDGVVTATPVGPLPPGVGPTAP